MATEYGRCSKRVSPADIESVTLTNMTLVSSGSDSNGGFTVTAYVNSDSPGCGNPLFPVIYVNVKSSALANWSRMTFKSYGTFVASCWQLNDGGFPNNMLGYSSAAGDSFFRCINSFNLPQFTLQTAACDNDPTNVFHSSYAVGSYRVWYQTRRRNNLSLSAGPCIYLSCNSVGSTSQITISDMFIYT